jgi:hypothetical protein
LISEITKGIQAIPPYFNVVVRLAWSKDPESYAGGNVATGRAFNAREVKGDDPDDKECFGSPR